jgi:GH24 family phage-related lysozyme (muramidase)
MSSETLSFEQATPLNTTNISQTQPEEVKSELDFSQAEPIKTEVKVEEPVSEGIDFSQGEEIKVSNLEKLEYAFDKNTQMLGNIYRITKAKVQDIFDEDKTFKDYILENEEIRKKEIEKEHWKFASGKYDDDGIVKAGELATLILDPGYILAYATPWGRAAMKSYKMAAVMGGLTISADVALRDLATTGELDYGKIGLAGTIGTALGPITPVVSKIFKKYAPQTTQKQIDEIVTYIDNKIAKKENITVPQLKNLRTVTNDKEVVAASKNLIQWSNANFVAPVSKEVSKFKQLEKTLLDKRNLLIKIRSLKGRKKGKPGVPGMLKQESLGKQIIDIRSKLNDATKTLEKTKAELYKAQQPKIKKYAELVAKRDGLILEKLRATESNIDWAVRSLTSATVKPLVGGATGLTAGVLFGDEDTKLMNWFVAGAAMGATQKYIQASKKFQLGDKNKILGIIDSEATKYTLQQIRAFTSATSSTKLEAYGGATEQVGKLLLETIDSTVSQKSVVANADRLTRDFTKKAYNLIQPYSAEEQTAAISIVRGKQLTKDTPQRVEELAKGIKNYLDEFKKVYNDAGFFSKTEIQDYFPRVFNWEKINQNPDAFKKTLEGIFKSLKYKDPKKAAETYFAGHRNNTDSVFNREILSELFTGSRKISGTTKYGKEFVYTPISEHISQERSLSGPYKLVEEVLEKNGYLSNDAANILTNIVNKSMRSIAFTRQFGENGQLLKPFFQQIKQKYDKSGLPTEQANRYAAKEASLLADTIDAYFDRYGKQVDGLWRSSAAILSTLSNLNMLGRVTISSLGDIVQPFQNSAQFGSWFKALPIVGQRGIKTAFTVKGETGIAQDLNLAITNEIRQGLIKPLGVDSSNVVTNANWMGETFTQKVNNLAFKGLGLEWLTGFARRFAYNVGAGDAYGLSKTLNKMVKNGISLDKGKGLKVVQDLSRYNIKPQTALDMAKTNSIEEALKNSTFKKALNNAGITTSNRDALVPQISNRLLFTQSQNPWSRLMGQFMSWAMAKSAQTNKILQRIENGNTKTLIKVLASIPVYGGIQGLREFAKYGEVVTDFGPDTERWFAEAFRLSGMQGYLPDLFINKTVGPSSREPWYQFAPAFQVARGAGEVAQSVLLGKFDTALRKFSQDIAPFPEWQNWIAKLWGKDIVRGDVPIKGKKLSPLKFATGDIATVGMSILNDELKKNEEQELDLVSEKQETQVPVKETIKVLPKKKPEAADYMPMIKEYESLGEKIIVDGVERYKNYQGVGEENITSGYGSYRSDNKLEDSVTEAEANAQLVEDINERLVKVKENINNFDKFPLKVRQNLVSSWFRGSLSGSPKTLNLINEGKYKEASKEFLRNEEYKNAEKLNRKGIKKRMENTAKAIESLENFNFNNKEK